MREKCILMNNCRVYKKHVIYTCTHKRMTLCIYIGTHTHTYDTCLPILICMYIKSIWERERESGVFGKAWKKKIDREPPFCFLFFSKMSENVFCCRRDTIAERERVGGRMYNIMGICTYTHTYLHACGKTQEYASRGGKVEGDIRLDLLAYSRRACGVEETSRHLRM